MTIDNASAPDTDAAVHFTVCDAYGTVVTSPTRVDRLLDPVEFIEQQGGLLTREKIQLWLAAQGPLNCIEIRIPLFTDGRAFSVAARLREAGYTGELHASGDITQDVLYLLRRVGFSHMHLPLKPGETLDPALLSPFGAYYQTAHDERQAG